MSSKNRIDVWISPEGAITLDAVGYTGSTCEEATRFLEESLGTVGRKQRTRIAPNRMTPGEIFGEGP